MHSLPTGSPLCILLLLCSTVVAYGQLSPSFYARSCPQVLPIVRAAVRQAVGRERRMGASLLRLHFHDCFVNGCDGSILLDATANLTGEKNALPNANSVRGFEVIDNIKTQLERVCSGVVSCADILTIAATESVVQLGGPSWTVSLGRRDSRTASKSDANTNIPSPFSSLPNLISAFQAQGLSARDMIALSGAHTIGQAQCSLFRTRIYNESNINAAFASFRKATCPSSSGRIAISLLWTWVHLICLTTTTTKTSEHREVFYTLIRFCLTAAPQMLLLLRTVLISLPSFEILRRLW